MAIAKKERIFSFVSDYIVIDFETTGLNADYDEIIEIGALKVANNEVVDEFGTLINPQVPIGSYITDLTGITNEMVKHAPTIEQKICDLQDFIGDSAILGHNVHFDISFLASAYQKCIGEPCSVKYIDTVTIGRKVFPHAPNHQLGTLIDYLGISTNDRHRALADCYATHEIYQKCRLRAEKDNISISPSRSNKNYDTTKTSRVTTEKTDFNTSHPLYQKVCVFTGELTEMTRAEAAKAVVDAGGHCWDSVTMKITTLIIGQEGVGTGKYNKAHEYNIRKSMNIEFIDEKDFYSMCSVND